MDELFDSDVGLNAQEKAREGFRARLKAISNLKEALTRQDRQVLAGMFHKKALRDE